MKKSNDDTFFPDKRPGEKVVHVIRRHWTAIAKHVVLLFVIALIPIVLFVFFSLIADIDFFEEGIPQIIAVLGSALIYLFAWLFFFHNWIDYYLDVWIVTNQRILNIEQEGLFSRVVSETNIVKIQDVTSEVHGKMPTFLDYGNVYVQSAGEEQRFVFEEVEHPREIAQEILRLHDQAQGLIPKSAVSDGIRYDAQKERPHVEEAATMQDHRERMKEDDNDIDFRDAL